MIRSRTNVWFRIQLSTLSCFFCVFFPPNVKICLHVIPIRTYVYTYACHFFVRLSTFFFPRALFGKTLTYFDTGSPTGHIGRDLGAIRALRSAWRPLGVVFPAGVDKTISLVSRQEAFFCTYVSETCCLFSPLGSHELGAHNSDIYQVHSRQHAQIPSLQSCRPHAVRVRYTHVRSRVAVAGCVGACRPYYTVCHIFVFLPTVTCIPVHYFVLLYGPPPDNNIGRTSSFLRFTPHTLRVWMIVLRLSKS